MSDEDTAGDEEEVSITCRRLPARSSIFAPVAERLLTRAVSRTRSDAFRFPPSFLRRADGPSSVRIATSMSPSLSRSPSASD